MSKLAQACELSFNEWIESFPEVMPVAERSPKHEKWKKQLFNKMRNDRYHVLTTKSVNILLIAAILCALLMSAFVFPSSREALTDNFDIFSTFKMTKDNNNYINSEIKVGYIPEGYYFSEIIDMGKYKMYRYSNNEVKFFTIMKQSSSIIVDYNSEEQVSSEIVVNNVKYICSTGDSGVSNIVWTKNDYVYRISGKLNSDELFKIAINIE